MNIKDFLIDNYIWILVIILITIITIIGFLADKKKGDKKTKDVPLANPNPNQQPVNNAGPMQYIDPANTNQMNNNMAMNFNNLNTTVQPVNQNVNMPNNNQNLNNVTSMNTTVTEPQMVETGPTTISFVNNPQPVENITPNVNQETMYQPLSEQKPVIPPQPVPNFSNMQNNQVIPQPVETVVNENSFTGMTQGIKVSTPEPTIVPNYNIPTPTPQPIENNNFNGIPNYNQNNTTIPQPVNPQPIMNGFYNNNQMPQQNVGQATPQPNNNPQFQQAGQVQNQPINFVYGPQNNNQNM